MTDGRNDGSPGGVNRSHQSFVAEGEEVFQGATTAGNDDDIDGGVGVKVSEGGDDLLGRHGALYPGVVDDESGGRPAQRGMTLDVTFSIGASSGDETDAAGRNGNRPMEGDIEEPFSLEKSFASL